MQRWTRLGSAQYCVNANEEINSYTYPFLLSQKLR